jgi:hypothetical protein
MTERTNINFYAAKPQHRNITRKQRASIPPFRNLCIMLGLAVITTGITAAETPKATIDNGILHATIYLPDSNNGFYRGTRFDWSGVIGNLTFAGHSYYDPWFTKMDPTVRDFVFDGSEITAGSASAVTGPAEEFVTEDGAALGFKQASPGQTFVKIGVGTLRKPDDEKYSSFRNYAIVDSGKWTVRTRSTSIQFTQKVVDRSSGYGYLYTKVLRLEPGQPILVIDHTLKNLGRLPILTSVYDHNFLVLDHQTTGPDFSVRLPFSITPERPIKADLGTIDNDRIQYRKKLEGHDVFTAKIAGFGATPQDYDIRVENSRLGAGVRIRGDHPLEREVLWSIRSILAMEPFIQLSAAPGATIHWSYSYLYYTMPQKN